MLLISKALKKISEGSSKPPDPTPMPTAEPKDLPDEPITVTDILDIFSGVSQLAFTTEWDEKPVAIVLFSSDKEKLSKEGFIAITSEELSYLIADSEGNPYPPEKQRENFEKFVKLVSAFPYSSLEVKQIDE